MPVKHCLKWTNGNHCRRVLRSHPKVTSTVRRVVPRTSRTCATGSIVANASARSLISKRTNPSTLVVASCASTMAVVNHLSASTISWNTRSCTHPTVSTLVRWSTVARCSAPSTVWCATRMHSTTWTSSSPACDHHHLHDRTVHSSISFIVTPSIQHPFIASRTAADQSFFTTLASIDSPHQFHQRPCSRLRRFEGLFVVPCGYPFLPVYWIIIAMNYYYYLNYFPFAYNM